MSDPNERIEGRCEAILRYIHNWRCRRLAVKDGLCKQHASVPCRVPDSWEHTRNQYGVLVPRPVGKIRWRRP
jgi:hypothetical protein